MKTIAQQLNITDFPFDIKDKNSRLIYSEDSNGYWNKYEYDSNGNVRYFENSDGYSSRSEYDSSGNRIYYENSDGEIMDNRPKEIITLNGIRYQRID